MQRATVFRHPSKTVHLLKLPPMNLEWLASIFSLSFPPFRGSCLGFHVELLEFWIKNRCGSWGRLQWLEWVITTWFCSTCLSFCRNRNQALSLWRGSTDSKILDYQITNPAAAAAAAKSLQSCLTLWNPIDGSPSGSPVPGILQARILEWVAISFSNAWKWKWSRSVVSDS